MLSNISISVLIIVLKTYFSVCCSANTTLIIAITKDILSVSSQTWDSACHSTPVRFRNVTGICMYSENND